MSMLDLITLSVLLGITPAVREAVAALSKGESKGTCVFFVSK